MKNNQNNLGNGTLKKDFIYTQLNQIKTQYKEKKNQIRYRLKQNLYISFYYFF